MKKNKKNRREKGQAMVEFALVLPLFLLLVMGILDFGFLFYNYISMENTARNVARIACIDYDTINYNEDGYYSETFAFDDVSMSALDEDYQNNNRNVYLRTKKNITNAVLNSLPMGVDKDTVSVTVVYSYDAEHAGNVGFDPYYRPTGDVTVTVTGDAHVLTPVLGVTADHMMKTLSSSSTFKVEKNEEITTFVAQ